MVNRELFAARLLSAVLAGHLVTLEYVASAEGNCLRRHRIELGQRDDFWDANALAHRLDENGSSRSGTSWLQSLQSYNW